MPQKKRDARAVRLSQNTLGRKNSTNQLKDIDMPETLDETLTSAQFILKSLMMSFDMNSK